MPTRIGIHAGRIMLGNFGAMDHFEYRPVGDIVNATTRLDGLNKRLATRILISDSVAGNLDGFAVREVGTFLLMGKAKPLKIYELRCRKDDSTEQMLHSFDVFSEALASFRQGLWEEAQKRFSAYNKAFGEDGTSRFYLDLCSRYLDNPPAGEWDGVIRLDFK